MGINLVGCAGKDQATYHESQSLHLSNDVKAPMSVLMGGCAKLVGRR
jgi:hypothetical protein